MTSLLDKEQQEEAHGLQFNKEESEPNYAINKAQFDGLAPGGSSKQILTENSEDARNGNVQSCDEKSDSEYQTTPWRWLILAVVFMATVC